MEGRSITLGSAPGQRHERLARQRSRDERARRRMAEQDAHRAMAVHRSERQTLGEMGEIFVEPQQLVSTRHVLARRIDEDDDRRAAARLHRGQDMTG